MPIERVRIGSSNDNYNPNGQGSSNLVDNSIERTVKGSSCQVRPDKVSSEEMDLLTPLVGEVVFDKSIDKNQYWDGSKWVVIGGGSGGNF